ncbi:MAG: hypothetical protein ACKORJ_13235, partial [Bacteroidota bacterium]
QAECASVVRAGYVQAEAGFNVNRFDTGNEWIFPTLLAKYGIANKLELRYISVLKSTGGAVTYQPDAAGVKVFLFDEKGSRPRATVIAQYHFDDTKRDNSEYNRKQHSVGELMFTFQNNFSERSGIGYNFGPEFHSDGSTEWVYRVTPGWNISEHDFLYVEAFGRFARARSELWADGGVARYLTDDLKVDVSAGVNLQGLSETYVALGISWRFRVSGSTARP